MFWNVRSVLWHVNDNQESAVAAPWGNVHERISSRIYSIHIFFFFRNQSIFSIPETSGILTSRTMKKVSFSKMCFVLWRSLPQEKKWQCLIFFSLSIEVLSFFCDNVLFSLVNFDFYLEVIFAHIIVEWNDEEFLMRSDFVCIWLVFVYMYKQPLDLTVSFFFLIFLK